MGKYDTPPTANGECMTRDERCSRRGEEDDGVGHLPHVTEMHSLECMTKIEKCLVPLVAHAASTGVSSLVSFALAA